MEKEKKYNMISDPGHGWLSVSIKELKEANLLDKISSYSYMTTTRVYLEEDLDAQIFINYLKENNIKFKLTEKYQNKTPIRYFSSYSEEKAVNSLDISIGKELYLYSTKDKAYSIKAEISNIEKNKIFIKDEFENFYKGISSNKFLSLVKFESGFLNIEKNKKLIM